MAPIRPRLTRRQTLNLCKILNCNSAAGFISEVKAQPPRSSSPSRSYPFMRSIQNDTNIAVMILTIHEAWLGRCIERAHEKERTRKRKIEEREEGERAWSNHERSWKNGNRKGEKWKERTDKNWMRWINFQTQNSYLSAVTKDPRWSSPSPKTWQHSACYPWCEKKPWKFEAGRKASNFGPPLMTLLTWLLQIASLNAQFSTWVMVWLGATLLRCS